MSKQHKKYATPIHRKTQVLYEGEIKIQEIKTLSRKRDIILWKITTATNNIHDAYIEHPFSDEKGSPQLHLTTNSDSLDLPHYTLVGLDLKKCKGWRFDVIHNSSQVIVMAYR